MKEALSGKYDDVEKKESAFCKECFYLTEKEIAQICLTSGNELEIIDDTYLLYNVI